MSSLYLNVIVITTMRDGLTEFHMVNPESIYLRVRRINWNFSKKQNSLSTMLCMMPAPINMRIVHFRRQCSIRYRKSILADKIIEKIILNLNIAPVMQVHEYNQIAYAVGLVRTKDHLAHIKLEDARKKVFDEWKMMNVLPFKKTDEPASQTGG